MTDTESVGRSLEDQAERILAWTDDPAELVAELEFPEDLIDDQYADWHAKSPLEPMVRALFLKQLEDYSFSELHRLLDQDDSVAQAFGFEDVPARTTFGRAWRDRFDDGLQQFIEEKAMAVAGVAWRKGVSVGLQAFETEDKSELSERSKRRYVNEKIRDVTAEMQKLVFPCFGFNRAENAHYEQEAFLELQTHMGLTQSAAESGTDIFAQDTDRPHAPDGDTHLHAIQQLDPDSVLRMVDDGISVITSEAAQHLDLNRPVTVAIDMTYVPYYGDREELDMVIGAPPNKEYEWCYKFATLTVVGEQVKFTLAMRPVQKGYHVWEVVDELLAIGEQHARIGTIYTDSEFCSAGTIRVLERENVEYIIPSPKNKRVKREIGRMRHDVKVIQDYGIYGPVPSGQTQKRGGTNLVLVPSTQNANKTVAFITSKDVSDETEHDRDLAMVLISQYSRRWGIENSYKTIKDFLAWTTSKEYTVRLFYFGFAVLLYNLWLIVDMLVQISLNIERRNKPQVTAKRFLNVARKQLTAPT